MWSACLSHLSWMVRKIRVGDRTAAVLRSVLSRTCPKQYTASFYNSNLAISPCSSLTSFSWNIRKLGKYVPHEHHSAYIVFLLFNTENVIFFKQVSHWLWKLDSFWESKMKKKKKKKKTGKSRNYLGPINKNKRIVFLSLIKTKFFIDGPLTAVVNNQLIRIEKNTFSVKINRPLILLWCSIRSES